MNITGSTALTTGNISGTGSTGVITYSNTYASTGNTLNFASGANSFSSLVNSAATGTLTLTGVGSTNAVNNSFSANNAASTTVFQSGTYTFTAPTNSSSTPAWNIRRGGGDGELRQWPLAGSGRRRDN